MKVSPYRLSDRRHFSFARGSLSAPISLSISPRVKAFVSIHVQYQWCIQMISAGSELRPRPAPAMFPQCELAPAPFCKCTGVPQAISTQLGRAVGFAPSGPERRPAVGCARTRCIFSKSAQYSSQVSRGRPGLGANAHARWRQFELRQQSPQAHMSEK